MDEDGAEVLGEGAETWDTEFTSASAHRCPTLRTLPVPEGLTLALPAVVGQRLAQGGERPSGALPLPATASCFWLGEACFLSSR